MKIKKNDLVKVISGNYEGLGREGAQGVPRSRPRHRREGPPDQEAHAEAAAARVQQGGIVEKEAPIHVSDVMLVCPKCGKPTRTSVIVLGDGSKARQCKKCKEMLSDQE